MIKVKSLTYCYHEDKKITFQDFTVNTGGHWLLLGESGSGKTTLLHLLGGLLTSQAGVIEVNGTDTSNRTIAIGASGATVSVTSGNVFTLNGNTPTSGATDLTVAGAGSLRIGRDDAYPVVIGVGHIHLASLVDRNADRAIELRLTRRAIAIAGLAVAGQRSHQALRRDLADQIVPGIGHINVPALVDGQARWRMEGGRAASAVGVAFMRSGQA